MENIWNGDDLEQYLAQFRTPFNYTIKENVKPAYNFDRDLSIIENDKQYIIELNAAGIIKDNLLVDFDQDKKTLTIKDKQLVDYAKNEENILISSSIRINSDINRKIIFQKQIDPENIKAELKNGILTITLNKLVVTTKITNVKIN